ncbi:MAG: DUF1015 domain-containing protein [Deltaproteobacteria bacterium]|nr:DUF1015 domain-containing protein [Deltaproteobacteria bacterium]
MATLNSFRGLRYDPTVVGDVARVVAPPYDVIDPAHQAGLYTRSPHNVVRLILNRETDAYAAAAATFGEWRRSGVLALDPSPALYLYVQRFQGPTGAERERIGIIGALRLESFESGKVRPHERTLERAKNDRLALLRACRASLSPIFGLVSAPEWSMAALVPARAPALDVAEGEDARHRVWRLDDARTLAAVSEQFAPREVFIADGHHRYETALRYRDETRAALGAAAPPSGAAPYDYVLTYLTCMEDPGLVILPTHRVLGSLPIAPAALERALGARFRLERLPWTPAGVTTLLERLGAGTSAGGSVRIGAAVAGAGMLWLVSGPVGALPFPASTPAVLRALDVTALHQIVLAGVLGLPIGERGGTPGLTYTQDAAAALAAVERGGAAAAFFLPTTGVDALRAVSLAGLTMPEKSTYFHPKLLTGLVIYPIDGSGG